MRNLEIEGVEIPYNKLREVYVELENIFGEGLSEQINSLEGEIVSLKVKLAMKEYSIKEAAGKQKPTNPWLVPNEQYLGTPILY